MKKILKKSWCRKAAKQYAAAYARRERVERKIAKCLFGWKIVGLYAKLDKAEAALTVAHATLCEACAKHPRKDDCWKAIGKL